MVRTLLKVFGYGLAIAGALLSLPSLASLYLTYSYNYDVATVGEAGILMMAGTEQSYAPPLLMLSISVFLGGVGFVLIRKSNAKCAE